MMVKTALILLALPMAAAKMRGAVSDPSPEEMFPAIRQLMGGMNSNGCPDPGDAPGILCASNADCVGSPFCAGLDNCCCVSWTFPYCGVPSDCNQFLQCLPNPGADVFSATAAADSFETLARVATCLAEDEEEGFVGIGGDSEDVMVPPPPTMPKAGKTKGAKVKSSSSSSSSEDSGVSKIGKRQKRMKLVKDAINGSSDE